MARQPDSPPHGGKAQEGSLVPVSGVDEAEGRVREQVGEEKIARNGRNGTSHRYETEMKLFCANTLGRPALEPNIREKCAHACVQAGVLSTRSSMFAQDLGHLCRANVSIYLDILTLEF